MTTVIHTAGGLDPASGGTSRVIARLCGELGIDKNRLEIFLVTGITENPCCARSLQNITTVMLSRRESALPHRALSKVAVSGQCAILHDHGQWLPINNASAAIARQRSIPRIVSPHGMLSPWALNHKRWKKRIAWLLYASRDLRQAAVIHATSELERRELRDLGVRQAIAMIPNGVDPFPTLAQVAPPERPYVLFLSRIHKIKGIKELLAAWRELAPEGWDLILAGPDEQGLMARSTLPPGARYVGMVDGERKAQLMHQARLFVLPTYSENFGVVVAESLMAGLPVITTQCAPWECLEAERCGWWIPMTPSDLREMLRKAMATSPAELSAMGERGRRLVQERFAWPEIARQMVAVYEWVLGGGTPPAWVETV